MSHQFRVLAAICQVRRFTYRELADRVGVPVSTVRTVVDRHREFVRVVDREQTGGRGGQPKVWELVPERRPALLRKLGGLDLNDVPGAPVPPFGLPVAPHVLEALEARKSHWDGSLPAPDRRQRLRAAAIDLSTAKKEVGILAGDPGRMAELEARYKAVEDWVSEELKALGPEAERHERRGEDAPFVARCVRVSFKPGKPSEPRTVQPVWPNRAAMELLSELRHWRPQVSPVRHVDDVALPELAAHLTSAGHCRLTCILIDGSEMNDNHLRSIRTILAKHHDGLTYAAIFDVNVNEAIVDRLPEDLCFYHPLAIKYLKRRPMSLASSLFSWLDLHERSPQHVQTGLADGQGVAGMALGALAGCDPAALVPHPAVVEKSGAKQRRSQRHHA